MTSTAQDRLKSAFKLASEASLANCGEAMEPHAIVFEALVEAMATLKALPDPEAGWLYSQGFWPQIVADREDEIENYREMLRRITSGEESVDVLFKKRPPTTAAIGRMDAIFEVFPRCLIGKERARDWKIMCFLANGLSLRKVATLTHTSTPTVMDRRNVQCRTIAKKLGDMMPLEAYMDIIAPAHPRYQIDRAA